MTNEQSHLGTLLIPHKLSNLKVDYLYENLALKLSSTTKLAYTHQKMTAFSTLPP